MNNMGNTIVITNYRLSDSVLLGAVEHPAEVSTTFQTIAKSPVHVIEPIPVTAPAPAPALPAAWQKAENAA